MTILGFIDCLRVAAPECCWRQPKRRKREGAPASCHISGTHGVSHGLEKELLSAASLLQTPQGVVKNAFVTTSHMIYSLVTLSLSDTEVVHVLLCRTSFLFFSWVAQTWFSIWLISWVNCITFYVFYKTNRTFRTFEKQNLFLLMCVCFLFSGRCVYSSKGEPHRMMWTKTARTL